MARRPLTLRGVGWDHERCMGPLGAAARAWRERAGVEVEWSARPLAAFNDQPLEELALEADLLVVDHPFSGTAAATGCLAPLDRLVPEETLEALAADAIGQSHASYRYAGQQWALALDAACQVAVAREDLLSALGAHPPATWDEVIVLAEAAPALVALPLYPTDAVCSLLTLAANAGHPATAGETLFSDPDAAEEALARLGELARLAHPDSFALNPPALLDRMRDTDDVAYAPLTFGYTNYARPGLPGRRLRFLDVPSAGSGPVGSLLGGAGLAVSAASGSQDAAAAFAAWICGADVQRELVFPAGGQPGSRSVWLDPECDAVSGGFFSGTLASIEGAYVRPRDAWWPRFQEAAGELVADALRERRAPAAAVEALERLFAAHKA
jgi:multiple sugar transport system substrate-binding protein